MIAFRLDANASVATGHLFRCISIAKQCRKKGQKCIFLLAEDECTDILNKEGFEYCILNLKWDDWNYGIPTIKQFLKERNADCLVVDSYKVTPKFFEELSNEVSIFYLDDLCNQKYNLDAVLHYSEWEDEHIIADLYKDSNVKVYSGMKYMPLREQFGQQSEKQDKKYRFLITTGGSDTYHVTLKLLSSVIADSELNKVAICVVLGKLNTDKEEIEQLIQGYPNIMVLQNISNMDEIMRQSNYAVTAGGTSVYELMASGVPFVCFGFSDDQRYFGERLQKHGNAIWAGDVRDNIQDAVNNIMNALKSFNTISSDEEHNLIRKNRELIDGRGAERIADIIIDLCKEKEKSIDEKIGK